MMSRTTILQILGYTLALSTLKHLLVYATADENIQPLSTIKGYLKLPDGTPLNTTLVTLNDGSHSSYSSSPDSSFTFHNVPPGIHVLDVHSHEFTFSQIKIQLLESSMNEPRAIEYVYPGAPKKTIDHPLQLTAHARFQYFEPRPTFSPFVLLKNPMILMMIFSVGMMVLMPKMMSDLDPEQKEQMKKQMEMQQDPSKMLSQLWGDLKGGNNDDNEDKKKIKREKGSKRIKRE